MKEKEKLKEKKDALNKLKEELQKNNNSILDLNDEISNIELNFSDVSKEIIHLKEKEDNINNIIEVTEVYKKSLINDFVMSTAVAVFIAFINILYALPVYIPFTIVFLGLFPKIKKNKEYLKHIKLEDVEKEIEEKEEELNGLENKLSIKRNLKKKLDTENKNIELSIQNILSYYVEEFITKEEKMKNEIVKLLVNNPEIYEHLFLKKTDEKISLKENIKEKINKKSNN